MKRESWRRLGRSAGPEVAHAQVAGFRHAEGALNGDITFEETRRGDFDNGGFSAAHDRLAFDGEPAPHPGIALVAYGEGIGAKLIIAGQGLARVHGLAVVHRVTVADDEKRIARLGYIEIRNRPSRIHIQGSQNRLEI